VRLFKRHAMGQIIPPRSLKRKCGRASYINAEQLSWATWTRRQRAVARLFLSIWRLGQWGATLTARSRCLAFDPWFDVAILFSGMRRKQNWDKFDDGSATIPLTGRTCFTFAEEGRYASSELAIQRFHCPGRVFAPAMSA